MAEKLQWKVHTKNLLDEIASNPQCAVAQVPLKILYNLLRCVAQRAIELNDPTLNRLMLRLTLYTAADPESPDYNPEAVNKLLNEGK